MEMASERSKAPKATKPRFLFNCSELLHSESCCIAVTGRPDIDMSKIKKSHHHHHLAMRDFATCFSEHAVKVSDASCSGSSSGGNSSVVDSSSDACVLSSVTCLYRTRLSTKKELLVRVTWSRSYAGPVLSIGVDDDPSLHCWNPHAMSCHLLRKKTGVLTYAAGSTAVGLYWDTSSAKYSGSSPEPLDDFYVVITMDAEFGLLLGDMSRDYVEKLEQRVPTAEFSMFSRKEQVLGHAVYSTRARFCDGGDDHDITIHCAADGWETKDWELSVFIDKKRVVYARRLRWNFRGNQTLFVDGSPVDMMWDVHGWLHGAGGPLGHATFMLRTRSALESRLWLEEESLHKEKGASGFTLLIQTFKST